MQALNIELAMVREKIRRVPGLEDPLWEKSSRLEAFQREPAILILSQSHAPNAVIPAWMPESSHREVNLRVGTQTLGQPARYRPWLWIRASMPE